MAGPQLPEGIWGSHDQNQASTRMRKVAQSWKNQIEYTNNLQ
jgi:hypothetical protein